MITNINDLQSSFAYGEYLREYIDQSVSPLANAGQRFGINATGIKYITKTCADIFNLTDESDINNKLLEIHFSENELKNIRIYDVVNDTYKSVKKLSTDESISFTNKLLIQELYDNNNETIINLINFAFNDINRISSDSYIKIENSIFTGFIKGKLNGIDDNISPNSKLIYFQYDINTNKLLHYIVTKYYGKLNEYDDWYIVYKLDYKNNNDNYELNIYLYRKEWLTTYINDEFDNDISITNINDLYYFSSSSKTLSFFNDNFIDYDCFLYNGPYLDKISFLNYIFIYDYDSKTINDNLIKFNPINITVQNNIFTGSEILNELYSHTEYDIIGYVSKDELSLFFINLQNIYNIYYQLYLYYNEITYFSTADNEYIYKDIIYQIYSYIRKEVDNSELVNKISQDVLYIPLTYTFNCFINDMNEANIYYLDNIYIKFLSNISMLSSLNSQIYYVNKYVTNHISIYKVSVDYNSLSNNIINDIVVKKLYTLPYLNALNNWVIDGIDTSFSITQYQYSIKELYIYNYLNNENKIESKILNFSDEIINQYFKNYTEESFIVNPKYFVALNGRKISCKVRLPYLRNESNDIIDFFKNTIIISICDKNILKLNDETNVDNQQQYVDDYQLDYVYSLWKLDNETIIDDNQNVNIEYKFVLITLDGDKTFNNENFAFDPYNNLKFNYAQKYNYIQNLATNKNLFNTNNSSTITDNVNLVIRNRSALQYHPQYHNNYNAIIEYIPENDIQINGDNPSTYNKLNKYINDLSATPLTNSIYPIYDVIFNYTSEESLKYILEKELKSSYKTYVSIFVNGSNFSVSELVTKTTINQIYQRVKELQKTYNVVEIGIARNSNIDTNLNFYNEFVFDNNVPTIDFKEVFLRNTNTLNRLNILGIESNSNNNSSKIYNGFIGTKYNELDQKNILYISTSETNINIGTDTLLNNNQVKKFNKFDTFQVDTFDNINLIGNESNIKLNNQTITMASTDININSKNNINLSGKLYTNNDQIIVKTNTNETITTYSTQFIPQGYIGNCMYISFNTNYINTESDDNITSLLANIKKDDALDCLFMPIFGLYLLKGEQINSQTIKSKNEKNKRYFYNSINLKNLLISKFGLELFNKSYIDNNKRRISYNINYVCNSNNYILEIADYVLFLFNDNSITSEYDTSDIKLTYKVFNYQLNITVCIDDINHQITVYVNFENDNINNLNNSFDELYTTNYLYNMGIGTFNEIYEQLLNLLNVDNIDIDNDIYNEIINLIISDNLSIDKLLNTFNQKVKYNIENVNIQLNQYS